MFTPPHAHSVMEQVEYKVLTGAGTVKNGYRNTKLVHAVKEMDKFHKDVEIVAGAVMFLAVIALVEVH